MKFAIPFLLVAAVLVSGCTSSGTLDQTIRQLEPVQQFLEAHPSADIRIVLWNRETTQKNRGMTESACGIVLEGEYYYTIINENKTLLYLWLDTETLKPACIYREGADDLITPSPQPKQPVQPVNPPSPEPEKTVPAEQPVQPVNQTPWIKIESVALQHPNLLGPKPYNVCYNSDKQKRVGDRLNVYIDGRRIGSGHGVYQLSGCESTGLGFECASCFLNTLEGSHTVRLELKTQDGKTAADEVQHNFTAIPETPATLVIEGVKKEMTPWPEGQYPVYYFCYDIENADEPQERTIISVAVDGVGVGESYGVSSLSRECPHERYLLQCTVCPLRNLTGHHNLSLSARKLFGTVTTAELLVDWDNIPPPREPEPPPAPDTPINLTLGGFEGYVHGGPAGFRGYILCFSVDQEHRDADFSVSIDGNAVTHTGEGIGQSFGLCDNQSFGIVSDPWWNTWLMSLTGEHAINLTAYTSAQTINVEKQVNFSSLLPPP